MLQFSRPALPDFGVYPQQQCFAASEGHRFKTDFAGKFGIFANLSKKSRRVLDMAEQDVITPLAPGGYILRTALNGRQASHKPRMPG